MTSGNAATDFAKASSQRLLCWSVRMATKASTLTLSGRGRGAPLAGRLRHPSRGSGSGANTVSYSVRQHQRYATWIESHRAAAGRGFSGRYGPFDTPLVHAMSTFSRIEEAEKIFLCVRATIRAFWNQFLCSIGYGSNIRDKALGVRMNPLTEHLREAGEPTRNTSSRQWVFGITMLAGAWPASCTPFFHSFSSPPAARASAGSTAGCKAVARPF